jgi:hypothetical protein
VLLPDDRGRRRAGGHTGGAAGADSLADLALVIAAPLSRAACRNNYCACVASHHPSFVNTALAGAQCSTVYRCSRPRTADALLRFNTPTTWLLSHGR